MINLKDERAKPLSKVAKSRIEEIQEEDELEEDSKCQSDFVVNIKFIYRQK